MQYLKSHIIVVITKNITVNTNNTYSLHPMSRIGVKKNIAEDFLILPTIPIPRKNRAVAENELARTFRKPAIMAGSF